MTEGRAASRLAVAIAEHLRLGRGLSGRSVSLLATTANVRLGDLSPVTVAARPSAMQPASGTLNEPAKRCARCRRWLRHPHEHGGRFYGRVCLTKVI